MINFEKRISLKEKFKIFFCQKYLTKFERDFLTEVEKQLGHENKISFREQINSNKFNVFRIDQNHKYRNATSLLFSLNKGAKSLPKLIGEKKKQT